MTSDFIRVHTQVPFLSPFKTQESDIEHPAHFVLLALEVLGPDAFDTVICLSSSSESSELITISSQAFKHLVIRWIASIPSALAISLPGSANPSPWTPCSSKRSYASSGSRSLPSPPPILTPSPWYYL